VPRILRNKPTPSWNGLSVVDDERGSDEIIIRICLLFQPFTRPALLRFARSIRLADCSAAGVTFHNMLMAGRTIADRTHLNTTQGVCPVINMALPPVLFAAKITIGIEQRSEMRHAKMNPVTNTHL
jgi:hypothetical protein